MGYELYLEPVWARPAEKKRERKPHPLKGKRRWVTDDPEKRAKILEGLAKGWHSRSKNKGCTWPRIAVAVYDLAGNFVSAHATLRDAAGKYGISVGNISKCVHGRRGRAGQYQFRKADVVEFRGERLVKKTPIGPYKCRM